MEINITWNVCRVCLVEEKSQCQLNGASGPMRHIFNVDKMLPKQIYECSGVEMKINDNLPEKICNKCLNMVKLAVNFRKTCRDSDTYLQSILQRTTSASALFKPGQGNLENLSIEFISNDCVGNDNVKSETEESNISRIVKKPKTVNHQGTISDAPRTKFRNYSSSMEINTSLDDIIEHEDKDELNEMYVNNIVEEDILSECSETCLNTMLSNEKGKTILEKNSNDGDQGNAEYQIDIKSDKSSHTGKFETVDINNEDDNVEESEETLLNDLEENGEKISEANTNKQKLFHEDQIVSSKHEHEKLEMLNFCGRENQQEILHHAESNVNENEMHMSTTATATEYDIIEIEDESSILSVDGTAMQTEFILDDYLIDGSSSDLAIEKANAVVIKSKIIRKDSNKSRTIRDCYKKTVDSGNLSIKRSSEHQVWICDLCGNHFAKSQLLYIHMKIHRQEKKHECELCAKRFITACNLQAHMRTHTGEKPFECQYCSRRFSDRSTHLRHERIHTNEKPFQCKECEKKFSLAATLKKHLKVHTDERLFRCDICAKSFKLAHQLKAHKKSSVHKAVEQML